MENKLNFYCSSKTKKEDKLYQYIPTDTTLSLNFDCDYKELQTFIDLCKINDKINLMTYNPITKEKEVRLCKFKITLKIIKKKKGKRWIKRFKINTIYFEEIKE